MSFAKLVMAGASAFCILTSVASADPLTGRVTGINRLTQQTQDGTIGTTIGASEEQQVPRGAGAYSGKGSRCRGGR